MKEKEFKDRVISLRSAMYRLALSFLSDSDEAQDAVQDALGKLWERRESLGAYDNLNSFVLVVVRNGCLDRIRRLKTRASIPIDTVSIADNGGRTEYSDLRMIVARVMDELPEKQRTTMHLRDVEGLEFDEIAQIMGADEGSIRANLSRARKKVKEELTKIMEYGTRKSE